MSLNTAAAAVDCECDVEGSGEYKKLIIDARRIAEEEDDENDEHRRDRFLQWLNVQQCLQDWNK